MFSHASPLVFPAAESLAGRSRARRNCQSRTHERKPDPRARVATPWHSRTTKRNHADDQTARQTTTAEDIYPFARASVHEGRRFDDRALVACSGHFRPPSPTRRVVWAGSIRPRMRASTATWRSRTHHLTCRRTWNSSSESKMASQLSHANRKPDHHSMADEANRPRSCMTFATRIELA